MADESKTPSTEPKPDAAEYVADAHRRLTALQQELEDHPELAAVIERLEMALSILATKTGGML